MPHTPGPWIICDATESKHIGYRAIITIDGDTVCNPSPMGNANAALIAASPDLLEALRRVIRHIPDNVGGCSISDDLWIARKAIAKATNQFL